MSRFPKSVLKYFVSDWRLMLSGSCLCNLLAEIEFLPHAYTKFVGNANLIAGY